MKRNYQVLLFALMSLVVFSCKNKANEAETTDAAAVAEATGATYNVNSDMSKVMWVGTKPTGSHNGTVNVASGDISVENGAVTGGQFVLDMTSITVLDLDGDQKAGLEGHLKGMAEGKEDHFFNVAQFPTATFEITNVTGREGDDQTNALVYGNLTMKGKTQNIGFPAMITVTDNAVEVTSPEFSIDRTKWGVNYGSKSIFDDLKDNFVNDEIALSIKLSAAK